MANLRERLANHAIVGLDTAVFIYRFEAHPRYVGLTTAVLDNMESGQQQGIISTVLLMELTVHPWRNKQPHIARHYEALFVMVRG